MDFHFFTTDDQVKLAYSVQGTGIPIVFLAGYGAPGELWFSQVQACVKAGFKAIVFDRPAMEIPRTLPLGKICSDMDKTCISSSSTLGL